MSEPDGVLQLLVELANNAHSSHSITVAVHGAVITGTLVAAEEYATHVAEDIRSAAGYERDQHGLDVLFNKLAEEYKQGREQAVAALNDEEAEGHEPPRFIHVKDGYTVSGNNLAFGERCWWRIRIADVSAWTLAEAKPTS